MYEKNSFSTASYFFLGFFLFVIVFLQLEVIFVFFLFQRIKVEENVIEFLPTMNHSESITCTFKRIPLMIVSIEYHSNYNFHTCSMNYYEIRTISSIDNLLRVLQNPSVFSTNFIESYFDTSIGV